MLPPSSPFQTPRHYPPKPGLTDTAKRAPVTLTPLGHSPAPLIPRDSAISLLAKPSREATTSVRVEEAAVPKLEKVTSGFDPPPPRSRSIGAPAGPLLVRWASAPPPPLPRTAPPRRGRRRPTAAAGSWRAGSARTSATTRTSRRGTRSASCWATASSATPSPPSTAPPASVSPSNASTRTRYPLVSLFRFFSRVFLAYGIGSSHLSDGWATPPRSRVAPAGLPWPSLRGPRGRVAFRTWGGGCVEEKTKPRNQQLSQFNRNRNARIKVVPTIWDSPVC
jgi:hypothetical protein